MLGLCWPFAAVSVRCGDSVAFSSAEPLSLSMGSGVAEREALRRGDTDRERDLDLLLSAESRRRGRGEVDRERDLERELERARLLRFLTARGELERERERLYLPRLCLVLLRLLPP